ncbi:unnamed protein product [Lota lota]
MAEHLVHLGISSEGGRSTFRNSFTRRMFPSLKEAGSEAIVLAEVTAVVRKLCCGKASEVDQVSPEMLQSRQFVGLSRVWHSANGAAD